MRRVHLLEGGLRLSPSLPRHGPAGAHVVRDPTRTGNRLRLADDAGDNAGLIIRTTGDLVTGCDDPPRREDASIPVHNNHCYPQYSPPFRKVSYLVHPFVDRKNI